ncbi:hypothetical protein ACEQ8H_004204 [Pleosporales sp. CAS-2024a]
MKSNILLPLYVYPAPGAWDPLYKALDAYPSLNFTAIINPQSGPGDANWWPNADYMRELPKLNTYWNVQIVGYVRSTYCQRPINQVFQDIQAYANRSYDNETLQIQGVFVDETVNQYTPTVKTYLDSIDNMGWKNEGIGGERLMIHNPGTAVHKALAEPGPDVTVVSETSYNEFIKKEYQDWLATSPYDRSGTCYMLNSVPQDKIQDLTKSLRNRAEFLFLTSATSDFYQSFDTASWSNFVAAMAAD